MRPDTIDDDPAKVMIAMRSAGRAATKRNAAARISFTTSLVEPDKSISSTRSNGADEIQTARPAVPARLRRVEVGLDQACESAAGAAIDHADVQRHQLRIDANDIALADFDVLRFVVGRTGGRFALPTRRRVAALPLSRFVLRA